MLIKTANPNYFRDMHHETEDLANAERDIEQYRIMQDKHDLRSNAIFDANRNMHKPEYLKGTMKGAATGALILGGLGAALGGFGTGSLKGLLIGGGIGALGGGLIGAPIGVSHAVDKRDAKVRSHLIMTDPKFAHSMEKSRELDSKIRPLQSKLESYHAKINERDELLVRDLEDRLQHQYTY